MSLRPDVSILARLREAMLWPAFRLAVESIGTSYAPTFQSLIDMFFLDTSWRHGFVVRDPHSGKFEGRQREGRRQRQVLCQGDDEGERQGGLCGEGDRAAAEDDRRRLGEAEQEGAVRPPAQYPLLLRLSEDAYSRGER